MISNQPEPESSRSQPEVSRNWYATYTRARHEKLVAEQLEQRSISCFLPLYKTVRKWTTGPRLVGLPLFPGYLFVRIGGEETLRVLQVRGVVRLVGTHGRPIPISDPEIESLRTALLDPQVTAQPCTYLKPGARVLIRSGPFRGLQGTLLRKGGKTRVVISLDLIMRSIVVEVASSDVERRLA